MRKLLLAVCRRRNTFGFLAIILLLSVLQVTLASGSPSPTGNQWEKIIFPPEVTSSSMVRDFAVNPDDTHLLLAATTWGLYRSKDAGDSWEQATVNDMAYISQVYFIPGHPLQVYALAGTTVFRSNDGGKTFSGKGNVPGGCGLAVSASDPDRLYTYKCGLYPEDGQPTIYQSNDGGQTWKAVTFTTPLDGLAVSPTDPNHLIAIHQSWIYISTDDGQSWKTAPLVMTNIGDGRIVFSQADPNLVYIGTPRGLLRSLDGGQSWQMANTILGMSTPLPSRTDSHVVLGGFGDRSFLLISKDDTWQAQPWSTPSGLIRATGEVSAGQVLYAQTYSDLWRFVSTPIDIHNPVYLPLVSNQLVTSYPDAAQKGLERVNQYRIAARVPPIQLHPFAVQAAQNHADYYLRNYRDTSAGLPHGEVEGKPGFTGGNPGDRLEAAGFGSVPDLPLSGWGEDIVDTNDPDQGVDILMDTVFHRYLLLDPEFTYLGYGNSQRGGASVSVVDMAQSIAWQGTWTSAKPHPLVYPADGQTGIPTSFGGGEIPNPLPPGASTPTGFPITVQAVGGFMNVTGELRDSQGHLVDVYTGNWEYGNLSMIPTHPLKARTTYTAHITGSIYYWQNGSIPFDQTWSFITGE